MTVVADERPRSYDRFEAEDLELLLQAALDDLDGFEKRHRRHAGLSSTLMCVALCQGAAHHLVTGDGGVHDFDVWSFFRAEADRPAFPVRRRACRPFEGPRFLDSTRRIDLLGRTIPDVGTARASVASYLESGKTMTSRALAKRPVFILHPKSERGPLQARR